MDTLLIEQDASTKDLYVNIPRQLLERLGWEEGDEISWETQKDGTIKIKKANSEENYYNSESEGKEIDTYVQATNEDTYGIEGDELTED